MAVLVIYSGDGQVMPSGWPVDTPLQVRLTNGGVPVVGTTITWVITSGPGTLTTLDSVTNSNGIAEKLFFGDRYITMADSWKTSEITASAPAATDVIFHATTIGMLNSGFTAWPTTALVKPSVDIGLIGNPSDTLAGAVQVTVKATSGTQIWHGIPYVAVTLSGPNPSVNPSAVLYGGTELTTTEGLTADVVLNAIVGGPTHLTLAIGGFAQYTIPLRITGDASGAIPISGDFQYASPGAVFQEPIYVFVRNAAGAPVVGAAVVWSVVTPASLTILTGEVTTDSRGWAGASVLAGATPGQFTITATASGDTATFNLVINDIAVVQTIEIWSGDGQSAVVGSAFSNPLVVQVLDAALDPVPGVTVTFTVAQGSVTVGSGTDDTASYGLASTTVTAGSFSGPARVLASITDTSVVFNLTVTGETVPPDPAYGGSADLDATLSFTGSLTIVVTNPLPAGVDDPDEPAADYSGEPKCLAEYDKHPQDILDITPDWADWLDGDTITGSTWTGDGLTVVSSSFTDTTTTVRLSGGTTGEVYEPKNTITTILGRTEVRRIRIAVKTAVAATPVQVGWLRGSPG